MSLTTRVKPMTHAIADHASTAVIVVNISAGEIEMLWNVAALRSLPGCHLDDSTGAAALDAHASEQSR
jgi:hypothetical protein